jgi:hypothetical protein
MIDCQSNAKPSKKDHDLPGIRTRTSGLHHLGRLQIDTAPQQIFLGECFSTKQNKFGRSVGCGSLAANIVSRRKQCLLKDVLLLQLSGFRSSRDFLFFV